MTDSRAPVARSRSPAPGTGPRPPLPDVVMPGLTSALMQIYQTKDYRFINLLFLGDDDRDFVDLMHLIGRPELASDATASRKTQTPPHRRGFGFWDGRWREDDRWRHPSLARTARPATTRAKYRLTRVRSGGTKAGTR